MKVRFHQSGGFAGLLRGCEIDTTTLPSDKAEELEQLIQASGIAGSGKFLSESGRDLHEYEITIDDGSKKKSVVYDDLTVPPSAKPLIGYLKKCAKPEPLA